MLTAVADRDFLFEPVELEQLSLFAHIVDTKTTGVLVKNDTDRSIILPRNWRLGHLQELGRGVPAQSDPMPTRFRQSFTR